MKTILCGLLAMGLCRLRDFLPFVLPLLHGVGV